MNSRIGFLVKKKKGNWAYWWCSCKIKKIFRPSSSSSPFQKSAQIDPSQYSQYSFSIPILFVPGVNPTSSLRFSLSFSFALPICFGEKSKKIGIEVEASYYFLNFTLCRKCCLYWFLSLLFTEWIMMI